MSTVRIGLVLAMLALAGCSTAHHKQTASAKPESTATKFILFFHPWSYQLTPEAQVIVNHAAEVVKETSPSTVAVAGYTDSDGSAADNWRLAKQRVASVQEAMIADGVDPKLFLSIPLGTPDDTVGMTGDRRIEIRLTYGN
ncbi:MAG TPA: OmpA family protein [Alphaproteobacteria bacterium]|nr:OmpA family protein [Alphaproteobacteria bacterium]